VNNIFIVAYFFGEPEIILFCIRSKFVLGVCVWGGLKVFRSIRAKVMMGKIISDRC